MGRKNAGLVDCFACTEPMVASPSLLKSRAMTAIRTLLLCAAVACVFAMRAASAQALTTPPLAADEVVVTTATGCAVVGRWSPERQLRNGMWLAAVKNNLADIRFDRSCPPGELITGHPGEHNRFFGNMPPNGTWYYFGRPFGIIETTNEDDPYVSVRWDGRKAGIPMGVGSLEGFARLLAKRAVSTHVDDDTDVAVQVEVRSRFEDRKLPSEQRRYDITVTQGERDKTIACPPPADAASCYPLWLHHATPVIERAQRLIDESRPKIEARREAIKAYLQGLGRQP
jgi:hypothetical protein